ncbi:hypothetical protein QFC22_006158 [Naganishia vaughanmartiniae]|uniref:Uncharacterized protein n=1 Tax=Naganishia vaughanmartiniae TaxID=1424756 RepID=A0ACC2WN45_9TREE|nr:hypothetical protein QFC22_006158 [Naganishia vaughanmartiniae]
MSLSVPSSLPISATFTGPVGWGYEQSTAQATPPSRSDASTIPISDLLCKGNGFEDALQWIQTNIPGTRPTLSFPKFRSTAAGSSNTMLMLHEETGTARSEDKSGPPNSQQSLTETTALHPQSALHKGSPAEPSKQDADDAPAVPTQAEIALCIEEAVALFCKAQDLSTQVEELPKELQKDVEQFLTNCLLKRQPKGKQEKEIVERAGGAAGIASGILAAHKTDVEVLRRELRAATVSATVASDSHRGEDKGLLGVLIAELVFATLGALIVLIALIAFGYVCIDWKNLFASIRYAIADALDYVEQIPERLRRRLAGA